MNAIEAVQVIGGMALVTYVPRLLPMLILSGKKLPPALACWLGYVPVAVMGSLLCASLVAKSNELAIVGFDVRNTVTAVPTLYVAFKYQNILLTVAVGVVAAGVMRLLMP